LSLTASLLPISKDFDPAKPKLDKNKYQLELEEKREARAKGLRKLDVGIRTLLKN